MKNLDPECLNVVGAISAPGKVREVQLDIVPPILHLQWYCADERFHSRHALYRKPDD